jgi:hypothetical protein
MKIEMNTRTEPTRFAFIDDGDADVVAPFKWCAANIDGRLVCMANINGKTAYMHRLIMRPPVGMVVDHINGNAMDNRRSNLRVCHGGQNARNRRVGVNNTTGYKGVTWTKSHNLYMAKIGHMRGRKFLGYYKCPLLAANAYDDAAIELHGEYARLNFPIITG